MRVRLVAFLSGLAIPSLVFADAAQMSHGSFMGEMGNGTALDFLDESNPDVVDTNVGRLNSWFDVSMSLRDMLDATENLSPDDAEFEPDYSPENMPQVPTTCSDNVDYDCMQCYEDAYNELNFLRYNLEKLRSIYGATKHYANQSMAFGDSVSGLHGALGISWQYEKKGIQESLDKLKVTYDDRYQGMMRTLRRTLNEVAQCESQYFGVDDWYSRYGFIYYTFMEDRYRRSD